MFAAALPRLASALVQPSVIAAGLATGIVGGTLGVASGAIPVAEPAAGPAMTALYECPDAVRVVTSLPSGRKVLVTARSADGAWLEIYLGEPTSAYGWAPASALALPASLEILPISDCGLGPTPAPLTAPPTTAPTAVVTEAPTAPPPSPSPTITPKPTKRPTPKPTAPTGPAVSNLVIFVPGDADPQTGHYYIWKPSASCQPLSYALIDVVATDPDGVASVRLYYQPSGGEVQHTEMYLASDVTNTWEGEIEASDSWEYGVINYWVQATDGIGDESPLKYASYSYTLELYGCD